MRRHALKTPAALAIRALIVILSVTNTLAATIKVRTGTTVSGDISGWVVLKREVTEPDKGFAYLLVEGKNVSAIDELGVHLVKDSPVRALFVAGSDLKDDFSALGVAHRMAKAFGGQINARLNAGGGCCVISTLYTDVLPDLLLGEFRGDSANAQIIPSLEITTAGAKSLLPVADVVPFHKAR